ncbi:hypothetical protein ACS0TY_006178 [Phlomoides rotata]
MLLLRVTDGVLKDHCGGEYCFELSNHPVASGVGGSPEILVVTHEGGVRDMEQGNFYLSMCGIFMY